MHLEMRDALTVNVTGYFMKSAAISTWKRQAVMINWMLNQNEFQLGDMNSGVLYQLQQLRDTERQFTQISWGHTDFLRWNLGSGVWKWTTFSQQNVEFCLIIGSYVFEIHVMRCQVCLIREPLRCTKNDAIFILYVPHEGVKFNINVCAV